MLFLLSIYRVTFYFLFLILFIRILGKREVGQLSIFDLVVLLMCADIAAIGLEDPAHFSWKSIIYLVTLLLLQKLLAFLCLKFSIFRKILDGEQVVLIINGKINYKVLKKQMYNVEDLMLQLRNYGVMLISEVRLAILETNGLLSVFKASDYDSVILPVVLSGKISLTNMNYIHLTEEALYAMLDKLNIDYKQERIIFSDGKGLILPQKYENV